MKLKLDMNKPFLGVFYIGVILAIFFATIVVVYPESKISSKIFLEGVGISVVVANTPALQERGLSGVESLRENEGMLFIFPTPARDGFWMKDMLFPIDIIWFDADQKIVDMWENALPSSYPEIRTPRQDAQYVLEVPAGFVQAHNIQKGQKFELAQ